MYHPRYVEWPARKRAFSEHNIDETIEGVEGRVMGLRRSETDLIRIDKQRTFETAHAPAIDTADVLARVVQALGTIGILEKGESSPQMGVHGFSDSQILAEEFLSDSECPSPPTKLRHRAVSTSVAPLETKSDDDHHDWTWNGTQEQIQELRKMRAKMARPNELFRQAVTGNTKQTHTINIEITPPVSQTPPMTKKNLLSKILTGRLSPTEQNVSGQFEQSQEAKRYLENSSRGRDSTNSLHKQYLNATSRGRPSIFTATDSPDQNLLENTTIADLIRALEVAHIQENTPELLLPNIVGQKSRFTVEKLSNTSRRASMYPTVVKDGNDPNRRMSQLEKERDTIEELPSVNRSHVSSRRASMFPASFKSFQKLTENILSDQSPAGIENQVPPTAAQFNGARRASMAPRRIPTVDRPVATTGRRVSLIPGAGRHVISERLLREYPHVPQETRDLARQPNAYRHRPAQNFLCAPIGGSFALSMAAAYPGGIGTQRRRSMRPSPLVRDKSQSASSPHLSVRHELQPAVSPRTRHIRSVFRPRDDDRVPEAPYAEEVSGAGPLPGAYKPT